MRIFKAVIVLVSLVAAGLLAGCETMKGFGKDITDASTSVQQTLFE